MGFADGELVEVKSPNAFFVAPLVVSDKISRGMIFVPTKLLRLGVYRLFEENTTLCRVKLTRPQQFMG